MTFAAHSFANDQPIVVVEGLVETKTSYWVRFHRLDIVARQYRFKFFFLSFFLSFSSSSFFLMPTKQVANSIR